MSRSRVGLGCMRLSADTARATILAAVDAGATLLDTARVYAEDASDAGHNERLVASALRGRAESVRVVTKCGMRRGAGRARGGFGDYEPDGRASAILEDARRSAEALGRPPDLLLLHAPDPRVPLATSVRALEKAREAGLARAIGLSNVGRNAIEEALAMAPISALELALGPFDDGPARGGLVDLCHARGVELLAYGVLGGPPRSGKLAGDPVLSAIAARLGVTAAELVIAYLLHLSPAITPVVGARSPATARSAIDAGRLALDAATLAELDERFSGLATARLGPVRPPARPRAEVVMIMGVTGAGKSRATAEWTALGHERWNRDAEGGSLKGLAAEVEASLARGVTRIVADNTYLTRASRSDLVRAASRHDARVVCRFLDTPLVEAQQNLVARMLARHGALLDPEAMKARAREDPGLVGPTVLARMLRELEPPSVEEGFAEVVRVPFVRDPARGRAGVGVALEALFEEGEGSSIALRPEAADVVADLGDAPVLVIGWRPDATGAWLDAAASAIGALRALREGRVVELGVCRHEGGAPRCWCRPPLPGLWLAFAARHGVDPRRGDFVTATPPRLAKAAHAAHVAMARALDLRVRAVS